MTKNMFLTAMILAAGLGLAASPSAQAEPGAVAAGSTATAARRRRRLGGGSAAAPAAVCTVDDDGVNFRGGPGTEYPVPGQVNRGRTSTPAAGRATG
ncbi:hypothetical protein OG596_05935 [Streptomyces sp. NBC_01102]|uniref:hypothetical protein n=1 Tax=Streptomyces sp. NBC_01102 TaxID=2903749 RepID=UPI003862F4D5|nr:hypothetical protein OG596_05935 [Streptomyces sp. NBC_01102]